MNFGEALSTKRGGCWHAVTIQNILRIHDSNKRLSNQAPWSRERVKPRRGRCEGRLKRGCSMSAAVDQIFVFQS
jgi:hypothetical protein